MTKKVLIENISETLGGATTAIIDINPGDGNLTIDGAIGNEQILANGKLEYLENKGLPLRSLNMSNGQATLKLKANGTGGQPWFRLPWAACNGATEWQIHLNSNVRSDLTAHSDGGNIKLNLAGMSISSVMADTGGGNMDVVLPDNAADIGVTAKTGAGNVTVEIGNGIDGTNTIIAESGAGNVIIRLPKDLAARIRVNNGMGKAIMESGFNRIDNNTFQSSDFDHAANKVEITAKSGAGKVSVIKK